MTVINGQAVHNDSKTALLISSSNKRNACGRASSSLSTIALSHSTFKPFLQSNNQLLTLLKQDAHLQLFILVVNRLQKTAIEKLNIEVLFNQIVPHSQREFFFRQCDSFTYAFGEEHV